MVSCSLARILSNTIGHYNITCWYITHYYTFQWVDTFLLGYLLVAVLTIFLISNLVLGQAPRSNIFNKWILILYKVIDPVGDEAFWEFLRRIKGLYSHCDFLYRDLDIGSIVKNVCWSDFRQPLLAHEFTVVAAPFRAWPSPPLAVARWPTKVASIIYEVYLFDKDWLQNFL